MNKVNLKKERETERETEGVEGEGEEEGGREGRSQVTGSQILLWLIYLFDLLEISFCILSFLLSFEPTHPSSLHRSYGPGTEPGPEEAACVLFQVCSSLWWSFSSFSLSLFEPAPPALEALGLNHWTTREVPPPQLFPAHIQADFPQWPCDLNSGLSPFLESVSNASATPDNPKTIPSIFLFQGLCSLKSGFLPKRHLFPTVYLQWKKPGDVRRSPSHQLLTLSKVIRGRTIKNFQSSDRGSSVVRRRRRDDFIGVQDCIKGSFITSWEQRGRNRPRESTWFVKGR